MEISEIRKEIDGIDDAMLDLFIRRMDFSRQLAECKMQQNLPVLNKSREREILARMTERSGELELYAYRFFSNLFEISRSYQIALTENRSDVRARIEKALENPPVVFPKTATVAVQGVEGAYSQMACDKIFSRGNILYFNTFEAVFDAVEKELCQFGILPIENSSTGTVRAVYDLMQHKNFSIVRSVKMNIHNELLAKKGTTLSDIKEIYSHEQALGQCSEYLKSVGDSVKIIPSNNTAVAAKYVAESERQDIAVISSHNCADLYGLCVVADDIQNSDNNYTRFICITKDLTIYPGANRLSLILSTSHKPGALYELTSKFAALDINLTKLESCPILGRDFEFLFFFELEASVLEPGVVNMLEDLEQSCEIFTFLGNFAEV